MGSFTESGVVSAERGEMGMRAHRMVTTGLAALLLVGTTAAADQAEAAAGARPAEATHATAGATSTSASASSLATHRAVRAVRVRERATTAATLGKVTQAVRRSEYTAGVPASAYSVTGLRMSGAWARVTLSPRQEDLLDPATVLLRRSQGRWSVVDLGTAEVGCGVAPAATLRALRLDCG